MISVLDVRTATPRFPGIGRYAASLAAGLASLVQEAADGRAAGRPEEAIRVHLLVDPETASSGAAASGLPVVQVQAGPRSTAQQWEVRRALTRLGAGVFHATWFATALFPGVPLVLTLYDTIPLDFPAGLPAWRRRSMRWAMGLAIRRSDAVITISEASRQRIRHWFPRAEGKLVAIPLAAGEAFNAGAAAGVGRMREALGLAGPYVLYLGSNKPHKNLPLLVGAWKSAVSGWPPGAGRPELVIAGPMDPRYPGAEGSALRAEAGAGVRFLGPVSEALLPALYAGAVLFVFPSRLEGFGLPVLEAMACGTPVVCTNSSSLPEVAAEAGLTVPVDEPGSLAEAIRAVLLDPARLAAMRGRALKRAADFSWLETARRTRAIYADAAKARGGRRR